VKKDPLGTNASTTPPEICRYTPFVRCAGWGRLQRQESVPWARPLMLIWPPWLMTMVVGLFGDGADLRGIKGRE